MFIKDILVEAGLQGFQKEPTLFRSETKDDDDRNLVLRADDGLVASSAAAREQLVSQLNKHVKVQVSEPMKDVGDELEFLKRRYVKVEDGIVMYSGRRHLEGLLEALGNVKERDAPSDQSFLDADSTDVLPPAKARVFKECVGRLLYLSHTRPDIQFSVCCLASKMSEPTIMSMKWLHRVVGYLKRVPSLGFLIKPVMINGCLEFSGHEFPFAGSKIVLESVTDADWAGNRATRKSKSSVHLYLGGSLVASFVRSQRSVALSSGESEFVAMVSGATECVYLRECIDFMTKKKYDLDCILRSDSAAGRGINQRIGCGRIRHLDCGLLWVQDGVKQRWFRVGPISGAKNPADLGTKPLAGARLRELVCRAGGVDEDGEKFGAEELGRAEVRQVLKSASVKGSKAKQILPVLMILAQVMGADAVEGLGLAMIASSFEEVFVSVVSTMVAAVVLMMLIVGIPWSMYSGASLFASWFRAKLSRGGVNVKDIGVQVNRGMSRSEERFVQEYKDGLAETESLWHEEMEKTAQCERELRQCRSEIRELRGQLAAANQRTAVPAEIHVATSSGTVYHNPGCASLHSSNRTKRYRPCHH